MYKRCATHVATAYYIFYQQRQNLLLVPTPSLLHLFHFFFSFLFTILRNSVGVQSLATDPNAQKKVAMSLDPTYEARMLREKNSSANGEGAAKKVPSAPTQTPLLPPLWNPLSLTFPPPPSLAPVIARPNSPAAAQFR
jgi:hypothetical protein